MTEYETATLALREAALFIAIAHVVVSLLVGLGQIGIVYYGIRVLGVREAENREKADKRRHKAEKRRHTEAMTALQELIRRTSAPQGA